MMGQRASATGWEKSRSVSVVTQPLQTFDVPPSARTEWLFHHGAGKWPKFSAAGKSGRFSLVSPDSRSSTLLFAFASSSAMLMPAGPVPITKNLYKEGLGIGP